MQKVSLAGLAVATAIALASAPAVADPIVLNPNFVADDTASNAQFNSGNKFFVQNWTPGGPQGHSVLP